VSRKQYVATESDFNAARTIHAVLGELHEPSAAIEGRAFKNGIRVSDHDGLLATGDVIEVWALRAETLENVSILAFQNDFLIAEKPASLSTTADHRGARSLVSEVTAWLDAHALGYRGDAHPVSRLDVGVSGAVLFALTTDARKVVELASIEHTLSKRYVGIARGMLPGEGVLEGAIGRAPKGARKRPAIHNDGKPAQSRYRALGHASGATLLELEPITGRTHQLRIHLTEAGAPLAGDRTHGGNARITLRTGSVRELDRIMLHAESVTLSVDDNIAITATSPIPASMTELWSLLDGDALAWNALERPR
jgi:23S rRNA pseudouridine1911/1915/1917 synthase